jgi:hypothetical protein
VLASGRPKRDVGARSQCKRLGGNEGGPEGFQAFRPPQAKQPPKREDIFPGAEGCARYIASIEDGFHEQTGQGWRPGVSLAIKSRPVT